MEEENSLPENKKRCWWQVLRPLAWWLLLALVLYGIRTHQRLMAATSLNFSVTLAGQAVYGDTTVTFDGRPIGSGELISLGEHQFVVTNPKGVTFATNLFIWYGGRNFGTIDLKRATGTLTVSASPPAPLLTIQGPEWSVTLTNSTGISTVVPTDEYSVEAQYNHWQKRQAVLVTALNPQTLVIAPKLGNLQVSCNQGDCQFQIIGANSLVIEQGTLPASIAGLPEGSYTVAAFDRNIRWTHTALVTSDTTNEIKLQFEYGTVALETQIPGTSVAREDGTVLGYTPLTLSDQPVGERVFELQANNFFPREVSVTITANATVTVRTNLMAHSYQANMSAAREKFEAVDYDGALQLLHEILKLQPDDPKATALHGEVMRQKIISQATALGNHGDYVGGLKQLNSLLAAYPDNDQARQMLADFTTHVAEQRERQLKLTKQVYDAALADYADASRYADHEIKTSKSMYDVASSLLDKLQNGKPGFKVTKSLTAKPDVFQIEAEQEVDGGMRRCLIICGQTTASETQILFKILEYHSQNGGTVGINSMPASDITDSLKAQLTDGVQEVTDRIKVAIEAAPSVL